MTGCRGEAPQGEATPRHPAAEAAAGRDNRESVRSIMVLSHEAASNPLPTTTEQRLLLLARLASVSLRSLAAEEKGRSTDPSLRQACVSQHDSHDGRHRRRSGDDPRRVLAGRSSAVLRRRGRARRRRRGRRGRRQRIRNREGRAARRSNGGADGAGRRYLHDGQPSGGVSHNLRRHVTGNDHRGGGGGGGVADRLVGAAGGAGHSGLEGGDTGVGGGGGCAVASHTARDAIGAKSVPSPGPLFFGSPPQRFKRRRRLDKGWRRGVLRTSRRRTTGQRPGASGGSQRWKGRQGAPNREGKGCIAAAR